MVHDLIGRVVACTGIKVENRRVVATKCPVHRMSGQIFAYEVRRNLLSLGCDTLLTNGRSFRGQ
jgi:hypothetical protein